MNAENVIKCQDSKNLAPTHRPSRRVKQLHVLNVVPFCNTFSHASAIPDDASVRLYVSVARATWRKRIRITSFDFDHVVSARPCF